MKLWKFRILCAKHWYTCTVKIIYFQFVKMYTDYFIVPFENRELSQNRLWYNLHVYSKVRSTFHILCTCQFSVISESVNLSIYSRAVQPFKSKEPHVGLYKFSEPLVENKQCLALLSIFPNFTICESIHLLIYWSLVLVMVP